MELWVIFTISVFLCECGFEKESVKKINEERSFQFIPGYIHETCRRGSGSLLVLSETGCINKILFLPGFVSSHIMILGKLFI